VKAKSVIRYKSLGVKAKSVIREKSLGMKAKSVIRYKSLGVIAKSVIRYKSYCPSQNINCARKLVQYNILREAIYIGLVFME
jgi:hypothetical protein